MLLAEQVPLTTVATLQGVLSGERHRGADPDRLLGEARPRHPNDGCDNQGNEREYLWPDHGPPVSLWRSVLSGDHAKVPFCFAPDYSLFGLGRQCRDSESDPIQSRRAVVPWLLLPPTKVASERRESALDGARVRGGGVRRGAGVGNATTAICAGRPEMSGGLAFDPASRREARAGENPGRVAACLRSRRS